MSHLFKGKKHKTKAPAIARLAETFEPGVAFSNNEATEIDAQSNSSSRLNSLTGWTKDKFRSTLSIFSGSQSNLANPKATKKQKDRRGSLTRLSFRRKKGQKAAESNHEQVAKTKRELYEELKALLSDDPFQKLLHQVKTHLDSKDQAYGELSDTDTIKLWHLDDKKLPGESKKLLRHLANNLPLPVFKLVKEAISEKTKLVCQRQNQERTNRMNKIKRLDEKNSAIYNELLANEAEKRALRSRSRTFSGLSFNESLPRDFGLQVR